MTERKEMNDEQAKRLIAAERMLDILCESLHMAEAAGHTLPDCIDEAWAVVTAMQQALPTR